MLVGRPGSQTATEQAVRDLGREVEVVDLDLADHAAIAAAGAQISAQATRSTSW